jgi:SSS family solute:Na+ symporter
VSSFNAVFTYDLYQDYIRPGRPDRHYLTVGRWATVGGVLIGIGTAFFAAGFSNISNYFQVLFGWLNVPLFTVFIIGMFWRRTAPRAAFWGILVGTIASAGLYVLHITDVIQFRSDTHESLWGGIIAFVAAAITVVALTPGQAPKTADQLAGLVYGIPAHDVVLEEKPAWYRNPVIMGIGALAISVAWYIIVAAL